MPGCAMPSAALPTLWHVETSVGTDFISIFDFEYSSEQPGEWDPPI